MDNKNALQLFAEMVENTHKTTEAHKPAFWKVFTTFIDDLNRVSRQVDNDELRKTFFLMRTLARDPLQARLNNELQSRVKDRLDETGQEQESSLNEFSLDAATSLSVSVLSDHDGRDVIDMETLWEEMETELETLGNEGTVRVLLDVADALRYVYNDFVKDHSQEMVRFYEELEKSSSRSWEDVYRILTESLTSEDRKAILWKQSEKE